MIVHRGAGSAGERLTPCCCSSGVLRIYLQIAFPAFAILSASAHQCSRHHASPPLLLPLPPSLLLLPLPSPPSPPPLLLLSSSLSSLCELGPTAVYEPPEEKKKQTVEAKRGGRERRGRVQGGR